MAPKNARVWNEDLVTALRAREVVARQSGKRNQLTLGEGAREIEGVRADIYMFSNGRIVGLPTKKLSKTVDDLCRKIIAGNEPVLPPGYAPSSLYERNLDNGGRSNPFENDPYVKKIKLRGGAFAILMAFYYCKDSRQSMTKQQLCQAAQPFCDDAMEENYYAGRPYGAWKGIDTLIRHNFVHRQNAQRAFSQISGGIRTMGRDSFSLTREGELFIEQLFKVRPQAKEQLAQYMGESVISTPRNNSRGRDSATMLGSTSRSLIESDRESLKAWLSNANPGTATTFYVGKDRRKQLHRFCDELSQTDLAKRGLKLEHLSSGEGRGRELRVRLIQSSRDPMSHFDPYEQSSTPISVSRNDSTQHLVTHSSPPSDRLIAFSGNGCSLKEDSRSSRDAAVPPAKAAAEAAMLRVALLENKKSKKRKRKQTNPRTATLTKIIIDIGDSDEESTAEQNHVAAGWKSSSKEDNSQSTPASNVIDLTGSNQSLEPSFQKNTARKLAFDSTVLEILDSDDDDEDLLLDQLVFRRNRNLNSKSETARMSILIDSRERNRNRTPRLLRKELERLISFGPCAKAWPSFLEQPTVEECSLSHGDFNFTQRHSSDDAKTSTTTTLPLMIERKRIGDLVQRSATCDHWGQLQRMLSLTNPPISFLLLEGDFRTASSYVAFGSGDDWRKDDHTIDDELSLLRFVGRAILTSEKVRFTQTKDEQDSLRTVIALGLISAAEYNETKAPSQSTVTNPYKKASAEKCVLLKDILEQGGVPWQLSKALSKEIGSFSRLKALYDSVESKDCRSQLLIPLIEDACKDLDESKASVESWSRAVYAVFSSKAVDKAKVRQEFAKYRKFVTDDALLLCRLHDEDSAEEAVQATYRESYRKEVLQRQVIITLPANMLDLFDDKDSRSFFKTRVGQRRNVVEIKTQNGKFQSGILRIGILRGEELVEKLKHKTKRNMVSDWGFHMSSAIASELFSAFDFQSPPNKTRNVLLIRGLRSAMDQFAKKPDYKPEYRFVIELILAKLSVSYNTVVLQAIRKENDQDIVLRALALSCYHFQLLTQESDQE